MEIAVNYRHTLLRKQSFLALVLLLSGSIALNHFNNRNSPPGMKGAALLFYKEGYDAKTGKWIGKRPSKFSFAITPETYEMIRNWFATDSGKNNPNLLPTMAPKEGYTYIYTPYKDPAHPGVTGMSIQGANGYKGYWYADDLTKATDSVAANGELVDVKATKESTLESIEYGGYDARTGKWLSTKASSDAFTVSSGTYERIKNWYTTSFGTNNPLGLSLEVPRENFTYLYVPFNDPAHPGVIGMSFQGSGVYKGYWYADKIQSIVDSIEKAEYVNPYGPINNQPTQDQQRTQNQQANPPPIQQQQTNPPPIQAAPTNNIQQQSNPAPSNANQAVQQPNN